MPKGVRAKKRSRATRDCGIEKQDCEKRDKRKKKIPLDIWDRWIPRLKEVYKDHDLSQTAKILSAEGSQEGFTPKLVSSPDAPHDPRGREFLQLIPKC